MGETPTAQGIRPMVTPGRGGAIGKRMTEADADGGGFFEVERIDGGDSGAGCFEHEHTRAREFVGVGDKAASVQILGRWWSCEAERGGDRRVASPGLAQGSSGGPKMRAVIRRASKKGGRGINRDMAELPARKFGTCAGRPCHNGHPNPDSLAALSDRR